jgi:hypothetical protein
VCREREIREGGRERIERRERERIKGGGWEGWGGGNGNEAGRRRWGGRERERETSFIWPMRSCS